MIELFYSSKAKKSHIVSYVIVFATLLSDKMADQKIELCPCGVYIAV